MNGLGSGNSGQLTLEIHGHLEAQDVKINKILEELSK